MSLKPGLFDCFILLAGLVIITLWFLNYFVPTSPYAALGLMFICAVVVILIYEFVPWGEVPK